MEKCPISDKGFDFGKILLIITLMVISSFSFSFSFYFLAGLSYRNNNLHQQVCRKVLENVARDSLETDCIFFFLKILCIALLLSCKRLYGKRERSHHL
jgi:hypothetical protein